MSFMVNQVSVHNTKSIYVRWDSKNTWFDIRMSDSEGTIFEVTLFTDIDGGSPEEISNELKTMIKQLRDSCNNALEN